MKQYLFLCIALAATVCKASAQQKAVEQICITVDSILNAQRKVTAHITMDGYDGPIGIKLRGNSSLGFNQKKYTIELRDEQGRDVEAPVLGMPAHSDWVLLAPYSDVSAVRDPLAFQLWRDMGHWGPRTRMVELTMNGEYRGIYILSEAIKRGKDRVDIAKLKKSDTKGRDVTGGYLLRIDSYNEDDATFTSKVPGIGEGNMSSQVIWSCIYPKKKNLQPEQFDYIRNYVDTVEQVIQSASFADPECGYARYIDVPSFVDYFIHTELSLNADGYKRSAYFYKEKQNADGTGGKLVAGPERELRQRRQSGGMELRGSKQQPHTRDVAATAAGPSLPQGGEEALQGTAQGRSEQQDHQRLHRPSRQAVGPLYQASFREIPRVARYRGREGTV